MQAVTAVPTLSMVFMGVSLILSVGFPLFLYLFWRKRYQLKAVPMLSGIAGFVLFALILEQLLHLVVLQPDATGKIALADSPVLYMLYGAFAAGIFEETARFVMYKLLKKKYSQFGTSLSYGIGHGGSEAVLLAGLAMISNLAVAFMINAGTAGSLLTDAQIATLVTTAPSLFLISGLERVMAISIQIALSVIMWHAATKSGKLWLYPLAVLLHALVDFPAALMQVGVLTNVYLVEGLVFIEMLLIIAAAVWVHRRHGQPDGQPSES